MAEPRADATAVDPSLLVDSTLGDLPPVAATEDVLVLAFCGHDARGPEVAPIPPEGLTIGRGCPAFPGGPLLDPRLSRVHLHVGWWQGAVVVRDLGSSNGTRLNGASVHDERPVELGGVIRAGSCLFVRARRTPDLAGSAPDTQIVGSSEVMVALRRSIAAVAPHRTTVLITGETGTGKELVAAALHRWSRRRGAFVPINCAAMSEGVLESELFGHKRGAFTGAVSEKQGLFLAADGGTLFLDEVGEMPLSLQVKLLRALESRAVRPVGASHEQSVDARVVAATNRELVEEVRAGRFRADLYARLCQWTIAVPALRTRHEDVPELVDALLHRSGQGDRRVGLGLMEALTLHPFALNVRGLTNALGAALIATPPGQDLELGPEVVAMLAADRLLSAPQGPATEAGATPSSAAPSSAPASAPREPLGRPAASPSPVAVLAALEQSRGSVAEVARLLGVTRQQIYRVIDSEGWELARFRP